MAYKSFNQRYPAFKWVMLLATTIVLVLTVFSVQYVSTNTKQEASTTCTGNGGACYKYSCSSGYTSISGSCGLMADSACCTPTTLAKPTGLASYVWYCKFGTPLVEYDTINFNWKAVPYATNYSIYYRLYSTNNIYSYKTISLSGNTNTAYLLKTTSMNGRRMQWYIAAKNAYSYASSKSDTVISPAAFQSCPQ